MYYIVRPTLGLLLTRDFTWMSIDVLLSNPKSYGNLLPVAGNIQHAQVLSQWFAGAGNYTTSPCTPKTLTKKYGVSLPTSHSNSFEEGVKQRRYPQCLTRRPLSKNEITIFQEAVQNGLSGLGAYLNQMPAGMEKSTAANMFQNVQIPMPLAAPVENVIPSAPVKDSPRSPDNIKCADETGNIQQAGSETENDVEYGPGSLAVIDHGQAHPYASSLIDDVKNHVDGLIGLSDTLPFLIQKEAADWGECDGRLQDLEHIAELLPLNAADGYRVSRDIQNTRIQRRQIKDELFVLTRMQNLLSPEFINQLRKLSASIHGLDGRKYTTRVLTVDDIASLIGNRSALQYVSELTGINL